MELHTTNKQVKCPTCATWNLANDYCKQCGSLLNYELKLKEDDKVREEKWHNREKDRWDIWVQELKTSRWLLVRIFYYIAYSIWFTLFGAVSFVIYLVAAGPG